MYKVIVVDDEPAALVLLCSIIEKKCPDYQVVATAENGREGLEKVDELLPDLVISDVSMPIMNGIQLVSAIKEKHPEILSLIVSGYSEFEYAKAALQSGVCDYILKPVIPSEMKKTLDRIGEKIRGYHYHHRNALVHQICNGAQCAPEELKKYFHYERYYCVIVRRNGLPRRFSKNNSMEIFSDINEQFIIYGRDEMEALYMIPSEIVGGNSLEEYLERIVKKLDVQREYVTTVYHKEALTPAELCNHIKKLYHMLDAVSVVGKSQMFCDKECEKKKSDSQDYSSIQMLLENLEYLLQEHQYEKARKELQRKYSEWADEGKPQLWLEYAARRILYLTSKYSEKKLPIQEGAYMLEDAFFFAATSEELIGSLMEVWFREVQESGQNFKLDSQDFFDSVENYLKSHLSENISLQSLCKKFGVSQTYMGKLFRKYAKQSFNQYLTAVRMERAIKIMRESPDIYIKDVATRVGYADQFYFSRIFRSYMGVCPSDYLEGAKY